jgi:MoaA/NifB/PqqE/SkfB family radical SAM enzyme
MAGRNAGRSGTDIPFRIGALIGDVRWKADRIMAADIRRTIAILAARPSLFLTGIKIDLYQRRALAIRRKNAESGLTVPVIMLMSITARCPLTCPGCYMQQRRQQPVSEEMSLGELESVLAQARDLGISVIGLLGGEPLLRRQDVVHVARSFPDLLFVLVTNGQLLDDAVLADIAGCGNIVPFISIEGFEEKTDHRRGSGMFSRLIDTGSRMGRQVMFSGYAITVTSRNFDEVLGEPFIQTLIATGARTFLFIQYVPVEPGTDHLILTPEQREILHTSMQEFTRKYPAIFIAIPGNVKKFGGCLAAGRGFVHVSPSGDLEPCAVVPVSVANLKTMRLEEALRSPLLETIRRNPEFLQANGRCPLRLNPERILRRAPDAAVTADPDRAT